MKYREHLTIILMRDNGPRRNFRMRRSRFFALLIFFAVLPLCCAILCWQAWRLHEENMRLRDGQLRLESEWQAAMDTARRLENMAALLREEDIQGHEMVLRRLSDMGAEKYETEVSAATVSDGPGHEEFPAIDNGFVQVRNVQARVLRGSKLRIALDLHNTDNQDQATGTVRAILVTNDGKRHSLLMEPADVGDFRIHRFKRTVMVTSLPGNISTVNAQVIIEVMSKNDVLSFRNIYAVEQ
ncbi:MAG: hypothetical protein IJD16_05880 [Desulfovibrio sp.]|nr:hypothetical protein [Desulfovibrio sp.]